MPFTNKVAVHIDRHLTWRNHIDIKREQIKHNSLGGRAYNNVIKAFWKYGRELCGNSNIELIQTVQSKVRKTPWDIRNTYMHRYLNIP